MRMFWTLLTTALLLTVGSGANVLSFRSDKMVDPNLDDQWVQYVVKFNRSYHSSAEAKYRRLLWEDSLREMQKHTAEADLGLHTWWMGINQFSDMTRDEWAALFPRSREELPKDVNTPTDVNETLSCFGCRLPKEIDWNKKGKVTPVKNQGSCGCCYAFACVGAIESAYAIKHKKLLEFSEQEIVDCSKKQPYGNNGCHSGTRGKTMQYVQDEGKRGINLAICYPYTAKDDKACAKNKDKKCIGAQVKGFKTVHDEDDLKKAVAKTPVAIGVCLPDDFRKAGNGIYSGVCKQDPPRHSMLVVGYGADHKGNEYWEVKNSHGTTFGNLGFIKLARNKNIMEIGKFSVYPIVT